MLDLPSSFPQKIEQVDESEVEGDERRVRGAAGVPLRDERGGDAARQGGGDSIKKVLACVSA